MTSDVKKMIDTIITSSYIDPFSIKNAPAHLVNFASGVVAEKDIEQSLLVALERG